MKRMASAAAAVIMGVCALGSGVERAKAYIINGAGSDPSSGGGYYHIQFPGTSTGEGSFDLYYINSISATYNYGQYATYYETLSGFGKSTLKKHVVDGVVTTIDVSIYVKDASRTQKVEG